MTFTTVIDASTLGGLLISNKSDAATSWVIVDCRHDLADPQAGRLAYDKAHLPGAVFARLETDLTGAKDPALGRHPLPLRSAFEQRLRAWGVRRGTQIVAYDAAGGSFAARLWWLLRWLGHQNVAVLDGGWQAWLGAGLPTTTTEPTPAAGDFAAAPPLGPLVDAHTVLRRIDDPSYVVIDARAPERFRGDVEPLDPVAGHIPGAINRFWQSNLDAQGRFKTPSQLRREFDDLLGQLPASNLIAQCGSGVTACHHLLALEHAGLKGAALYAGSWSGWISDPRRPVAKGA